MTTPALPPNPGRLTTPIETPPPAPASSATTFHTPYAAVAAGSSHSPAAALVTPLAAAPATRRLQATRDWFPDAGCDEFFFLKKIGWRRRRRGKKAGFSSREGGTDRHAAPPSRGRRGGELLGPCDAIGRRSGGEERGGVRGGERGGATSRVAQTVPQLAASGCHFESPSVGEATMKLTPPTHTNAYIKIQFIPKKVGLFGQA